MGRIHKKCGAGHFSRQGRDYASNKRYAAGQILRAAPLQAVGSDIDQLSPGVMHRVSRVSARAEFQDIVRQYRDGACEIKISGAMAVWVACWYDNPWPRVSEVSDAVAAILVLELAVAAKELAPKQELVDKQEKVYQIVCKPRQR